MDAIQDATTLLWRRRRRSRTVCASRGDSARPRSDSNCAMCAGTDSAEGTSIVSRESGVGSLDSRLDSRLSLRASGLGLARELCKSGRARDGDLGQALAVERDAGRLQAADELPVRQAVLARGRVDADDPEAAEVALLAAAADERVLQRGVDRLFRGPVQLAFVGVVALGERQQLLALRPADCSSLYPRHSVTPVIKN